MMPDALFRLGRCCFEISRRQPIPRPLVRTSLMPSRIMNNCAPPTLPMHWFPKSPSSLATSTLVSLPRNATRRTNRAPWHTSKRPSRPSQEFVNRWPRNPLAAEALFQLARNQFALGRFDEAVGNYRKVVEGFPDSTFAPLAVYEIANCYGAENKQEEMVAQLRDFVTRYPNHPRVGNALYTIASQLERDGKTDEALAAYRDVIASSMSASDVPTDLRKAAIASEMRIAEILEARGDVAGAVAGCEALLKNFVMIPRR